MLKWSLYCSYILSFFKISIELVAFNKVIYVLIRLSDVMRKYETYMKGLYILQFNAMTYVGNFST